ncbi:DUF6795 domain-containing protein [Marinimicrobium locisalis]|uniref:DUF6795 domain-containing protein n=1 Tax=Marinimicrobium locisalis TaxID=546022 RepID=UPI003221CA38
MNKLTVIIILSFLSQEMFAMSFFNPGKTCVFSAVKAYVTYNGEPVKNATIIRRWEWKEEREERTQTDEHGYFEFPAAYESSVSRMLPIEIVIGQELFVVVDGTEKKIWAHAKRSADENSELKGREMKLSCELNEPMKTYGDYGLLQTLCSWEG